MQSPISTSYLLCVVYTILAFLTDNKNVECASMCEGVHAYVCEIRECMGEAVTANDLSNIEICSKSLHGLYRSTCFNPCITMGFGPFNP